MIDDCKKFQTFRGALCCIPNYILMGKGLWRWRWRFMEHLDVFWYSNLKIFNL